MGKKKAAAEDSAAVINEKAERQRASVSGTDVVSAALISVAVSLALFILTPACIFLHNQEEFPITFGKLMTDMTIGALVNSALLSTLLLVLRVFRKNIYDTVSQLLVGFLLASFVQSVFINSSDTVFSGDTEHFNHINVSTVTNFIVYIAIMLLPLIFCRVCNKLGKLEKARNNLVMYSACAAIAVQSVWAGVCIGTTEPELKETYTGYLSYAPAMSLSKEENIVVFLSDRLDGAWMDDLLEMYPELNEKLDGFTFYQNNVSHNTNTFPAVVQMLTHTLYNGKEWPNYMREAWGGDTLTKELKQKGGYNINLMPDCITTINNTRFIADQCDNIVYADRSSVKYGDLTEMGILHGTLKLSMARLTPYYLKGKMAKGLGANVGRNFIEIDSSLDDLQLGRMKPNTDMRFMNYLRENGLTDDSENKTFSFIHLSGAHTCSNDIAALYEDISGDADFYQTTRGDFEIIFEYMEQLKKLGLYDNTTILILGDHGRPPNEINPIQHDLKGAVTTALLVKPKGSSGKLGFDRYSELTNDFFAASILEYAGIDHKDFGLSYNDVINGDLHPDRYLQTIKFNNYGRLTLHSLYKITGDARDFGNWEKQPAHEHENDYKRKKSN